MTEGTKPDVALFIDWENLKYSLRSRGRAPNLSALRAAVEPLGRVVIARAYADWEDHPGDPDKLYQAGIEPQYVPTKASRQPVGVGPNSPERIPNSVDIKLTADCIECCHNYAHIQTFVLVAGDRDYIHAANILRPYGKTIVVIATTWSTSARLTERVDRVIYYDQEVDATLAAAAPQPRPRGRTAVRRSTWLTVRQMTKAIGTAVAIIEEYREQGRRPSVNQMKSELQRRLDFLSDITLDHAQRLMEEGAKRGKFRVITEGLTEWVVLPEDQITSGEGATAPDFEEQEPGEAAGEAGGAEGEEADGAGGADRDHSRWIEKNRPVLSDLVWLMSELDKENSYITFNFLLKGIERARGRAREDGADAEGPMYEHLRPVGGGRARGLVGRMIQAQILLPGMLPQINYSTGEIKEVRTLRLNREHPLVRETLGKAPGTDEAAEGRPETTAADASPAATSEDALAAAPAGAATSAAESTPAGGEAGAEPESPAEGEHAPAPRPRRRRAPGTATRRRGTATSDVEGAAGPQEPLASAPGG